MCVFSLCILLNIFFSFLSTRPRHNFSIGDVRLIAVWIWIWTRSWPRCGTRRALCPVPVCVLLSLCFFFFFFFCSCYVIISMHFVYLFFSAFLISFSSPEYALLLHAFVCHVCFFLYVFCSRCDVCICLYTFLS